MADETKFTQADIDAAIEKAVGPLKDSIGKLETKNEELIGENRKLKRGADIKPEDLTAAEDRADKAEKAKADLEKQVKALTAERDKAVKSLETEQAISTKDRINRDLTAALIANGVKDETFLDALTAKFAPTAIIKVDGDKREAMIGDKSLADAIKEFAGSDAGKKFVAAPVNGGGGAGGGSGSGGSGKVITQAEHDAMRPKDRAQFFADGGKIDQAA